MAFPSTCGAEALTRRVSALVFRSNQEEYEHEVAAPVVDATARTVICGCIQCPQDVADTLHDMMGLTLLKDPVFLTFAISNFLTSIGFNVPYIYIAVSGKESWLRGNIT